MTVNGASGRPRRSNAATRHQQPGLHRRRRHQCRQLAVPSPSPAKVSATATPGTYCNSFTHLSDRRADHHRLARPASPWPAARSATRSGATGTATASRMLARRGLPASPSSCMTATARPLLATTTTDANGNYYFNGVQRRHLCGQGQRRQSLAGLHPDRRPGPAGRTVHDLRRHRQRITLTANQQYLTADFGYKPTGTGTIGDKVFEDIGNDGVFNRQ